METQKIGIGIIGAGYMGKAHAVAYASVGAVFNTRLRPVLEMICTSTEDGAKRRAQEFGFNRSAGDWRQLVSDPKVEAVIIASPQDTHKDIALAAFEKGKPVFCEKPLGLSLDEARILTRKAEEAGVVNMTGFNYIRTPASQLAREMIKAGEIGEITVDELHPREHLQVLLLAGDQAIHHAHAFAAPQQLLREVGTNESVGASNEDFDSLRCM